MISKIIKLGQNINLQFIKGWKDDFGNVMPIFSVGGKKYCFIGDLNTIYKWNYCFGIGSVRPVSDKYPAGRGQYLTGPQIESEFVQIIFNATSQLSNYLERIPNGSGVSWMPRNNSELNSLKNLVQVYEEINGYLRSNGILYSEGDRYIYGKDITSSNIGQSNSLERESSDTNTKTNMNIEERVQNSANVSKFIEAMRAPFKEEFGSDFNPSGSRSAYEQAVAMQYPIATGEYDSLYRRVPKKDELKKLIQEKKYKEAGTLILQEGYQKYFPHMQGKAIDVTFSKNKLSTPDYERFSKLVQTVGNSIGVNAKLNSEKTNHFHVNIK